MRIKSLVTAGALFGVLATAGSALAQPGGADLFAQNCSACHQSKGEGVPGAFPALAGNKFLLSDPKNPAYVVTHGRGGMPNFSEDMSDAEIATVLTYARSAWGNSAAPIDAKTVASVRGTSAPPDQQAGLPYH
jgi:cytochrome c6